MSHPESTIVAQSNVPSSSPRLDDRRTGSGAPGTGVAGKAHFVTLTERPCQKLATMYRLGSRLPAGELDL